RCLAAGMDEYISKPVYKLQMIKVLSHWIRFGQDVLQQSETTAVALHSHLPILDLQNIRSFSGANKALEKEFAESFIHQCEKHLQALSNHIVDGHCTAWVETAHLLKGGAA